MRDQAGTEYPTSSPDTQGSIGGKEEEDELVEETEGVVERDLDDAEGGFCSKAT